MKLILCKLIKEGYYNLADLVDMMSWFLWVNYVKL